MQFSLKKKTLGLRLALVGALAALLGTVVAAAPATAAPPLPDPAKVTVNDTYIKTLCQFTVTSANYAAGTVRGRLTAKTSWNGQAGFKNLAHVSIDCYLYDSGYASTGRRHS